MDIRLIFFPVLSRGFRQGCPLSALLFIMAVEMLSIEIHNNPCIKSINVGNMYYSILQLAGDTTIVVEDRASVKSVLAILNKMERASGLNK